MIPETAENNEHDNPTVRIAAALEQIVVLLTKIEKHSEANTKRR